MIPASPALFTDAFVDSVTLASSAAGSSPDAAANHGRDR